MTPEKLMIIVMCCSLLVGVASCELYPRRNFIGRVKAGLFVLSMLGFIFCFLSLLSWIIIPRLVLFGAVLTFIITLVYAIGYLSEGVTYGRN